MQPTPRSSFGPLLRRWRESRRLTQEQLAHEAQISTRHLSCLETNKAQPSREMVLVLGGAMDLELRDRNVLLGAAGFAPVYRASRLDGPELLPLRRTLALILQKQEPFGAIVVDREWNVVLWNEGARRLLGYFMPALPIDPKVVTNVLHAIFSPSGLRPCVVNWEQVAALAIERLHREIALHPDDQERLALRHALLSYPDLPERFYGSSAVAQVEPFVPLHLRRDDVDVRLFTMLTTLGTPLDITAQELTIESYFPADEASEAFLTRLTEGENEGR